MKYPVFMSHAVMSLLLVYAAPVDAANDIVAIEEIVEEDLSYAHLQDHKKMEEPAIDSSSADAERSDAMIRRHTWRKKPKIRRFLGMHVENTPEIKQWMQQCILYGQLNSVFIAEEELRALCPGFIWSVQQTCRERALALDHLELLITNQEVRSHFDAMQDAIKAMPQKTKEEIDELLRQGKGFTPNLDLFVEQEQQGLSGVLKQLMNPPYARALAILDYTRHHPSWWDYVFCIQDSLEPLTHAAWRDYFTIQKNAMAKLFARLQQIEEEQKNKVDRSAHAIIDDKKNT